MSRPRDIAGLGVQHPLLVILKPKVYFLLSRLNGWGWRQRYKPPLSGWHFREATIPKVRSYHRIEIADTQRLFE
jgi:hypothetical protein